MILQKEGQDIQLFGNLQTEKFGIDENSLPIIFDILRNKMYADPIAAICREIASNSRDANREAGKGDVPIEITLNKNFLIEGATKIIFSDNGKGISPEGIKTIYTKYGASTKRQTNDLTGGFGLGSKTPFAYTDSFFVDTRVDGILYKYLLYIDETGVGEASLVQQVETSLGNGTDITIPLRNEEDVNRFNNMVLYYTSFWDVRPILIGEFDKYIPKEQLLIDSKEGYYNSTERTICCREGETLNLNKSHSYIIIDGIPYKINPDKFLFNCGRVFFINNGVINVSATREELQYDDITMSYLQDLEAVYKKQVELSIKNIFNKHISIISKINFFLELASIYKKTSARTEEYLEYFKNCTYEQKFIFLYLENCLYGEYFYSKYSNTSRYATTFNDYIKKTNKIIDEKAAIVLGSISNKIQTSNIFVENLYKIYNKEAFVLTPLTSFVSQHFYINDTLKLTHPDNQESLRNINIVKDFFGEFEYKDYVKKFNKEISNKLKDKVERTGYSYFDVNIYNTKDNIKLCRLNYKPNKAADSYYLTDTLGKPIEGEIFFVDCSRTEDLILNYKTLSKEVVFDLELNENQNYILWNETYVKSDGAKTIKMGNFKKNAFSLLNNIIKFEDFFKDCIDIKTEVLLQSNIQVFLDNYKYYQEFYQYGYLVFPQVEHNLNFIKRNKPQYSKTVTNILKRNFKIPVSEQTVLNKEISKYFNLISGRMQYLDSLLKKHSELFKLLSSECYHKVEKIKMVNKYLELELKSNIFVF